MFDLDVKSRLLKEDVYGLLNFQLEAGGGNVQDLKTIFQTNGETSQKEMLTDESGEVLIGFTNLTGITACT